MMQETVEHRSHGCGVAQQLAPVFDWTIFGIVAQKPLPLGARIHVENSGFASVITPKPANGYHFKTGQ